MHTTEILEQAEKLREVSENLESLAEELAPVSTELSILSGNVRRSAALLEVLVAMKMGSPQNSNSQIH
jgi:hypothetical protein